MRYKHLVSYSWSTQDRGSGFGDCSIYSNGEQFTVEEISEVRQVISNDVENEKGSAKANIVILNIMKLSDE